MVEYEKCVILIFTIISILLFNVTDVYANRGDQLFILKYIKGAPTSQVVFNLTIDTQNSREIIIDVIQLIERAKISVNARLIVDESVPAAYVTGSIGLSRLN